MKRPRCIGYHEASLPLFLWILGILISVLASGAGPLCWLGSMLPLVLWSEIQGSVGSVPSTVHSSHFSCSVMSDSLRPHGLQHARPSCPSPTPGVYLNTCPLSWWYHPTISSSVIPFPSHLQSFPASGSFQMNQLFASGGQSIGASASALVLPSVALQIPSSISNVSVHSLPLAKALKSQLPLEWPGRFIKLASSWAHLPQEILLQSFHVGPQEGHPLHSNR